MSLSGNEIWEKIRNNDKKSFEILFHQYHDSLCLFSYGIVRNEEAAEEIVNDVFFKIWMKRSQIQITFGISQYLFRCVRNASIDYWKQNRILMQYSFVEIDTFITESIGTNEEYIFNFMDDDILKKDVMNAIERLPLQCKIVFCLSRFELLTYHEISERLNISVNTVKTQMSRAIEVLRRQLEKYLSI